MIRLAVFDDEYVVVQGVEAMIRKMELDFEVVGKAYDGNTAFDVVKEVRPDVIMTDIRMPGMDGLQLIEKVKTILPDASCIVISGYQEFEYARTALNLGVKGYIDKPITMDKVKKVFEDIEIDFKRKQEIMSNDQHVDRIGQLTDDLTHEIKENSFMGIESKMQEIQKLHRKIYSELESYKLESYKLICILLGVFYEGHAAHEIDKHFPSFKNLEMTVDQDGVDEYIMIILESMIEKMKILNTGTHHQTIIKILEHITHHYNEDFGLNEMADMVDMNPNYLSNLFKEEVGISFVKYLTNIRIDRAKELLLEGEKVVQVSKKVGFNNYRYFCEIFKRYEGKTPSEYKGQRR